MAKVLVVDDDVDLVEMNKVVLETRGHTVLCAYTADEARQTLETETPDVVVLDVMMETLDAGFELARQINGKHPKMPILMLSAIEEKTGLGFKGAEDDQWLPVFKFIDKPVAPDELADKVEEVLDK